MKLNLKTPLVFMDIEATGLEISKDRIVEICMIKVHPNGNEEIKTYRVNPTIPIPKEVSNIHHIYDKDVENEPTFKEIAQMIVNFVKGCDFAGYNSNRFDFPLLSEEFLRAGIDFDMKKRKLIDIQTIFHKMEQRTLQAALKFYCNKTLDNAHSAEADTMATLDVLKSQLEKYDTLENDINYLAKFTSQTNNADFAGRIAYDKEGVEVLNFGKNKGVPVEKILNAQHGYYEWMMGADFPLYTKKILTRIKLRMLKNSQDTHPTNKK